MPNSYFRFKQFTVHQDLCAMKVGTDGVLLGAWASTEGVESILDIGTGTGLIALMLAQRSRASIDAIDIDEGAYRQAIYNFGQSPFSERLNVYYTALQDYKPNKQYDLIVSNPPYFSNSLQSTDLSRSVARHDNNLSLEELINHAVRLLSPQGKICLILPYEQYERIFSITSEHSLNLTRQTTVYPTLTSPPKRLLLEFSYINRPVITDELFIEKARHVYTEAYKSLTEEFYQ